MLIYWNYTLYLSTVNMNSSPSEQKNSYSGVPKTKFKKLAEEKRLIVSFSSKATAIWSKKILQLFLGNLVIFYWTTIQWNTKYFTLTL